tara:strand:- start:94973 stop:95713 length:741 start_codon:yes stop_codon:yes gene_type:complete
MSDVKELQFFNRDTQFNEGISHYSKSFEQAGGVKIRGESTPLYLEGGIYTASGNYIDPLSDRSLKRINAVLPDSKFLISLRNPVKRAVSIFWKNYYQGKYGYTSFNEYFNTPANDSPTPDGFPHIIRRSDYALMLSNLFEVIPRDRCYVTIFEDWSKDISSELHEILTFLEVDPTFHHEAWFEKQNTADRYRKNAQFGQLIAGAWQERRFKKEQTHAEQEVFEHLRDSIGKLELLLQRDLSIWQPR